MNKLLFICVIVLISTPLCIYSNCEDVVKKVVRSVELALGESFKTPKIEGIADDVESPMVYLQEKNSIVREYLFQALDDSGEGVSDQIKSLKHRWEAEQEEREDLMIEVDMGEDLFANALRFNKKK